MSACRCDPAFERFAITAIDDMHDARPLLGGDRLRTIIAAVVGNDHFAPDVRFFQRSHRLGDARADGVGLIEARKNDRDFRRARLRLRDRNVLRRKPHLPSCGIGGQSKTTQPDERTSACADLIRSA